MSLFAITCGQWSMIDAVLHVLSEVGPSKLSLWTWTVAEYEVQVLNMLRDDKRVTGGRLVIDHGARNKNAVIIADWQRVYGPDSVRYVINHAKIARIESASGLKLLLRGSMNLNFNPRFENFGITEGGPEYDLVEEIEEELILAPDCSGAEVYAGSKLDKAFAPETLALRAPAGSLQPRGEARSRLRLRSAVGELRGSRPQHRHPGRRRDPPPDRRTDRQPVPQGPRPGAQGDGRGSPATQHGRAVECVRRGVSKADDEPFRPQSARRHCGPPAPPPRSCRR